MRPARTIARTANARSRVRRLGVSLLLLLAGMHAPFGPQADVRGKPNPVRVIIVRSSRATPYVNAAAALEKSLATASIRARTFDLASIEDDRPLPTAKVYVAVGTPAAVKLHARVAPPARLVYCLVTDPRAYGLTKEPTCSGVTADVPVRAQFDLMKTALPAMKKVGLLYRSRSARSRRMLHEARDALPPGWSIEAVDLGKYRGATEAIQALLAKRVGAVWTFSDREVYDRAVLTTLLKYALARRTPVVGFSPKIVRSGGLLGTGIDPATQGRQAAALAKRILADGKARAVVIEPQYEISVNLKIARVLGIRLPSSLVDRAKHRYGGEK